MTGDAAPPPRPVATVEAPAPDTPTRTALPRRLLAYEVLIVFGVSLGASGLYAIVHFLGDLTAHRPLSSQTATLNGSQAPGRPWLDLTYQLLGIATALVPVALADYLLHRTGSGFRALGFDSRRPRRDAIAGALLAAGIGGTGLLFYLAVHAAGANLTVVPEALPAVWWRIPVLVLSAAQNALLEETLVVGYLLHRLQEIGVRSRRALMLSALVRGSYHFYQGAGGFAGNVAMGLVFAGYYQRTRRLVPLVLAHAVIDATAFVGYALLAGHVSWLPTP